MIICSRCGKENHDQFKYCLGCGLKLQTAAPAPAPAEPPKQPQAAAPVARPMAASGSSPHMVRPGAAGGAKGAAPITPVAPRAGGQAGAGVLAPSASAGQEQPRLRMATAPQDAGAASRLASAPTAWQHGGVPGAAPALRRQHRLQRLGFPPGRPRSRAQAPWRPHQQLQPRSRPCIRWRRLQLLRPPPLHRRQPCVHAAARRWPLALHSADLAVIA